MVRNRLFSAAPVALATGLVLASPAHAAQGSIAMPMVVTSAFAALEGCPVTAQAPAASQGPSKAAALLGGQASQLELMRRQQAGAVPVTVSLGASAVPAPGAGATLTGAVGCSARLGLPVRAGLPAPGLGTVPLRSAVASPDTILASKRLAVRHTPFDREWNRVRAGGVGRGLTGMRFGTPDWAGINAVNAWANATIRYVEDRRLYGQADRWATAAETLQRRAGDCEDIAIVKMQLLAAQGVRREDMQLVIARDLVRGADHAVLVVRLGARQWLLDNATDQVLDASQSYDYRPIMSFSGGKKWVHGY